MAARRSWAGGSGPVPPGRGIERRYAKGQWEAGPALQSLYGQILAPARWLPTAFSHGPSAATRAGSRRRPHLYRWQA